MSWQKPDPWTAKEDQVLRAAIAARPRRPLVEVGMQVGRTTNACYMRARNLGITVPRARAAVRKSRAGQDSAPSPAADSQYRLRKCLCCGYRFDGDRATFVCAPCKNTVSWRYGAAVA